MGRCFLRDNSCFLLLIIRSSIYEFHVLYSVVWAQGVRVHLNECNVPVFIQIEFEQARQTLRFPDESCIEGAGLALADV